MKTLFAGPFVGEFGFELFGWQSQIRHMSRQYNRTIVSSREENKYLYEDFCDEFVPHDPGSYNASGWDCYTPNHKGDVHDAKNPERYKYKGKTYKQYNPDERVFVDNLKDGLRLMKKPQEFFKYGDDKYQTDIDLVVHARKITKGPSSKIERNWGDQKWDELVSRLNEKGMVVASIGLEGFSYHVPGTRNLLNLDLKGLANNLGKAKAIIGPSSGPMHFATLCGCPQLVWGEEHLRVKYEKEWNPFGTIVYFYGKKVWNPSVDDVFSRYEEFNSKCLTQKQLE